MFFYIFTLTIDIWLTLIQALLSHSVTLQPTKSAAFYSHPASSLLDGQDIWSCDWSLQYIYPCALSFLLSSIVISIPDTECMSSLSLIPTYILTVSSMLCVLSNTYSCHLCPWHWAMLCVLGHGPCLNQILASIQAVLYPPPWVLADSAGILQNVGIPGKFQNDSKWNLNGIHTNSCGISFNLKSGLIKNIGKINVC